MLIVVPVLIFVALVIVGAGVKLSLRVISGPSNASAAIPTRYSLA